MHVAARHFTLALLLGGFLSVGLAHAQAPSDRPACKVLAAVNLNPLLGADHDSPVPFGESSCRAESKAVGRMVMLLVSQRSPAEIKAWMDQIRKLNTTEQAGEVTVAPEPALGADAFSVAEKGPRRGVEIYAIKGGSAMVLQGDWSVGGGISDAAFGQLRELAQAALAKLP